MKNKELPVGSTLQCGKYRIVKSLSQGGFGITYLAIQVRLDRKVAIKEFFMKDFCERNETTSQVTLGTAGSRETVNSCREKFLKEAQYVAKLNHPNIIRIIDDFDENSTSYYVMEYIEGGSLSNKLGTTGLSMSDATRYILQVAEALKYIHNQNIAHLDIKPSNIMLKGNDKIVLIDFGVSKQYDFSTGGQTSVSLVGCSSGYAPLEQYDPNGVKKFSPQTDIYSLGATYFKLLTGITPPNAFGITKDFLQENLKAKGVPTAVISIICKSMEKLKENRFSDVCSFIEELNSISLRVDDSSDKKDENIASKQNEEGTVVMPSQEEIDTWVKYRIKDYNSGRYDSAFEGFSEYAKMGNATAQYYLGKMYEDCHFRYGNFAKAIEWYRKSAEQGSAEAQCQLGTMYENGRGVSQDYAKAAEWFRKSAEQGDSYAQYYLGEMYYYGRGVSQDDAKAVEWYRRSAEQGNMIAQYNLGTMYCYGRGVSRDHAKAVEWYRKSAEQGDSYAQYYLGAMYYYGTGVSRDHAKAVEWSRKAAEQGHVDAQCQLGGIYFNRKEYANAFRWFERAAMRGNSAAQLQLGIMFKKGLGVYPNFDEAGHWFRESADRGNHRAANELNEMLSVGPVKWYQEIAEQGNAYAQYKLGDMYRNGVVVFQNNFKAVEWYRKSAEQGNTDAQYELGYMYHNGIGVSKDHTKAAEWYRKAAKGGDVRARKFLSSPKFKFKTFITNIFN